MKISVDYKVINSSAKAIRKELDIINRKKIALECALDDISKAWEDTTNAEYTRALKERIQELHQARLEMEQYYSVLKVVYECYKEALKKNETLAKKI